MATRKLYKYRAINSFTEEIIRDNKLYFANAKELNDPFDCRPVMTFSGIEEEYIEYLNDYHRHNGSPKLTNAEQYKVRQSCRALYDALEVANEQLTQNCGVCSMSELNNITMMYSHYADSHRGLCLEFTVPEDNDIGELKPVEYLDTFPEINQKDLPNAFDPQTDDAVVGAWAEKLYTRTYFSKASTWAYEREWRWFRRSPGLVEVPTNFLTGAILGCRISHEDKRSVLKMLEHRASNVNVYKAIENRAAYEMKIAPL